MTRVGLAGLGYWGPNLARNFDQLADLAWLSDLDEDVLAGRERALRELVVGGHGRRDHDRVERGVGEHLVVVGRRPGPRVAGGELGALRVVEIADPGELGQLVEVAGEVGAPVAETGQAHACHSFQTFSLLRPVSPVALRKSTMTAPSSTSAS